MTINKLVAALIPLVLIAPLFAASASQPVAKPAIVTREQWGSTPQEIPESRKHTPKYITIHHAGVKWKAGSDPAKFVKSMQAWGQRDKGWPDLAYHFLIAPDGRIFEGRDMAYEPESNTKYDLQGHIGVEMMGSFEQERVSEAQLKSVTALVAWLSQELKIPTDQIATHRDRAQGQTTCPGKDLYRYIQGDGPFIGWVRAMQEGRPVEIKLLPPLEGGPTEMIGGVAPIEAATQPAK